MRARSATRFRAAPPRERFPEGLKIIGNFPYNISSQIFFKVLENRDLVPECVGMIQKEVAVRLAEPPGSKEYGILSVLLQAWYDIEYLFTVNETVFNPPPKVKSAVSADIADKFGKKDAFTEGKTQEDWIKELYEKTLAIFGLGRIGGLVAERARAFGMHLVGYDPYCSPERAEQLGVAEFVELTNWVSRFSIL